MIPVAAEAIDPLVHDNSGLIVANNLLSGPPPRIETSDDVELRDNAIGDFTTVFRDAAAGDLHLARALPEIVDAGQPWPRFPRTSTASLAVRVPIWALTSSIRRGILAGLVFGVPVAEDGFPALAVLGLDEGLPHRLMVWVQRGVLDAELAHQRAAALRAVQLLGQSEMFADDFALLQQRWRSGQRAAVQQGLGLLEDPGVADGAARDGHSVHPGLLEHAPAVVGREQIAAAQDRPLARVPLDLGQHLPAAWSNIPLLDRAGMDRAAATPASNAPSRIVKNRSRLSGESSIPQRILTVTGISGGTASRVRRTISSATSGWLR
jgi:hypothetical protein